MKMIKMLTVCMVACAGIAQTAQRSQAMRLDTRKRDYEIGVCTYSFRAVTAFEAI